MTRFRPLLALALFWLFVPLAGALSAQQHYPGETWPAIKSPEKLGWSTEKLKQARKFSETLNTAAVVIVVDGRILDQWGETAQRYNVHSIRKSFLSALYGIAVKERKIALSATLAELKIDDREPCLTPVEKQAAVSDLLKARSGIYHHAAYETESMRQKRPARGSHEPGSFWYYNNWDFNALGTIYQQCTGTSVFEGYEKWIARPLQMQDFQLADCEFVYDDVSDHPAYTFRMSARDMARFGLLFLRKGKWKDRQVVPENWVAESTSPHSDADDSGGYGYMWWVAADGKHLPDVALQDGAYSARGHGGHYILVAPEYDMVLVHRVNTDIEGNAVARKDFARLVKLIIDAREQAFHRP